LDKCQHSVIFKSCTGRPSKRSGQRDRAGQPERGGRGGRGEGEEGGKEGGKGTRGQERGLEMRVRSYRGSPAPGLFYVSLWAIFVNRNGTAFSKHSVGVKNTLPGPFYGIFLHFCDVQAVLFWGPFVFLLFLLPFTISLLYIQQYNALFSHLLAFLTV
jgi:hypothetical protein